MSKASRGKTGRARRAGKASGFRDPVGSTPASIWDGSHSPLVHVIGYVLAFVFVFGEGVTRADKVVQLVGVLFLVGAVASVAALVYPRRLIRDVAHRIDYISSFPVFLTVIALFVTGFVRLAEVTQRMEWMWAIPPVLFGIIVYDLVRAAKATRILARSRGRRAAAAIQLKLLSFVILYFVVLGLALDADMVRAPLFWILPAFVSLLVALLLEGTLKE